MTEEFIKDQVNKLSSQSSSCKKSEIQEKVNSCIKIDDKIKNLNEEILN